MPNYLAVMDWNANNNIAKSMGFASQKEADAHIDKFKGLYPEAFVAVDPEVQASDMLVDPVARTVSKDTAKMASREKLFLDTQYIRARRKAYGDIGDELDMLYWDQVNGTTTFKDHVAVVKAAYPKP